MVKPESKAFNFSQFWKEIIESLSNRNWLVLFIGGVILALNIGIFSSLDTYFSIYFWQWTPEEIKLFPIIIALPVVLAGFIAAPLAKGRSKKNFAIGVFLVNLIIEPMPIWLRLLDPYFPIQLFPENGTDSLWWAIILFLSVGYFLRTVGWILVISMVYDVVEDGQLSTGRRDEGLYLSANGFIQKIISGLGVVIVGLLLEIVGFDVKNPTVLEMQQPIYRLAYIQAILSPLLGLASISCMFFYNISKSSHDEALGTLNIDKD
jgi:Na+/melibiose symporter-like transporter